MTYTKLFESIHEALEGPNKLPGWCSSQRASLFAAHIISGRPSVSLEIGVFGGRGTIAMAMAHKFNGFGHVYAIDPWEEAASAEGMTGENKEWWSQPGMHEKVMQEFTTAIQRYDLAQWIKVVRARSDNFAPPDNIGLLVIDGNHSDQAIKDAQRYCPSVSKHGIVYMDDMDWVGGGPEKATKIMTSKLNFSEIYRMDHGAFFRKNK